MDSFDPVIIKEQIESAVFKARCVTNNGKTAMYIPELANAPLNIVGLSLKVPGFDVIEAGDVRYCFTLQSISKIFSLALALEDNGADLVFQRVGMEPTADPFNSIMRLERVDSPRPLNPLINAGAIAVVDLIKGKDINDRFERVLFLVRELCDNSTINVNKKVLESERKTGNRNRALAYLMKDLGQLTGDVEEILDLYFMQCAIEVVTKDLAMVAEYLASPQDNREHKRLILSKENVKILRTLMFMCGMYDGSGASAVKIGIPSKSGVSGGILAIAPHRGIGMGVVGPSLDKRGNSIGGQKVLEILSSNMKLHTFD